MKEMFVYEAETFLNARFMCGGVATEQRAESREQADAVRLSLLSAAPKPDQRCPNGA